MLLDLQGNGSVGSRCWNFLAFDFFVVFDGFLFVENVCLHDQAISTASLSPCISVSSVSLMPPGKSSLNGVTDAEHPESIDVRKTFSEVG